MAKKQQHKTFTDEQRKDLITRIETDIKAKKGAIENVCKSHGISSATFYNWKTGKVGKLHKKPGRKRGLPAVTRVFPPTNDALVRENQWLRQQVSEMLLEREMRRAGVK